MVIATAGSGCTLIRNFANTVTPTNDLRVFSCNMNFPVPGNGYQHRVVVQNDGTSTQSTIQFRYKHDGQLSYVNSSPWALVQQNMGVPTWFSVLSGFSTLTVGAYSTNDISYLTPSNIPLGTQVTFYDTVSRQAPVGINWLSDVSPWNNVNYHPVTVVGSFDPNFKEVSPKGAGPEGIIARKDSILTYIVHFQNTGSYYAQNIVVVDTLDSDLNIATLHPGYSDHQYTATVSDNRVAKFSFTNINLPWKAAYGDAGSSGMFAFSIKVKNNLPVGTQIRNRAAIYFDYNKPIITNTTLNTIVQSITSLKETTKAGINRLLLYPNPATNYFDLVFESTEHSKAIVSIYDLSGRIISSEILQINEGANSFVGNAEHLQNGIYLVQLKTETAALVGKLIITK